MANEIVMVTTQENPWPFVVADGTAIPLGTLLKLTTGRTAIISSAAKDYLAGFAAREKVASDGRTELAVHRRGMALVYVSGAASAGQAIIAAATNTYPNFVTAVVNATTSGACILGHMLEDATNGQQKLAFIDVGAGPAIS